MRVHSLVSAFVLASPVLAFFRINCGIIQTGRLDPIVDPGAVSAHAHTIGGSSNIGVNSTYETLFNSECTSCEITKDKSAYWTPLLYYAYANGSFIEVPHSGSVVYYLLRGGLTSGLTAFPAGFRMVSGNPANRGYNQSGMTWGNATYPNRPISEAVSFACLSAAGGPETYYIANVSTCINGLRAQVDFQTCWNGVDLYKSDNSHVAHLSQIDNGICPPEYPFQFPHIFLETDYAPVEVTGTDDGGQFVFSMGDPTGYGFHGDFFNGWDPDVQQEAISTCIENNADTDGTIEECSVLLQYDDSQTASNCPERPAEIDEPVHGLLDKLPGCITITDGSDAATAADMDCPADSPIPSIIRTVDSVPLQTYMPTIGQADGEQVYVGCLNDSYASVQHAVAALEYNNDTSMTVELCQTYCNSRGYRISAVEDATECWCDLTINPSAIISGNYSTYTGCTTSCVGNRSEVCGGPFYVSVWNNTDPEFNSTTDLTGSVLPLYYPLAPFADTYIGCTQGNGLNGSSYTSANMTIEYCGSLCQQDNYNYYGLLNGDICECGNGDLDILDTITTSVGSSCGVRCAGNFSQVCGSFYYYSVYNNTAYTASVITKNVGRYFSKGCLQEPTTAGVRALSASELVNATSMTVELCADYCKGYRYFGIEYASQCFCGDELGPGSVKFACETWDLLHCPGDSHSFCGAGNVLNLYFSITEGA